MAIFKANANLKETADGTHWVMFNVMYRRSLRGISDEKLIHFKQCFALFFLKRMQSINNSFSTK
jgi:hypothetical protein